MPAATTCRAAATPAPTGGARVASATVPVPGACEQRRTGPPDAVGCYMAGTAQLGPAPATPSFWHLDAVVPPGARTPPHRHAGPTVRRTLTAVVHDAARPWTIPASDWTSNESCPQ